MNRMLVQLKKYLMVYVLFVKSSIMSEMEYRINFIANMCIEIVYVFIKLTYVLIVFNAGVFIRGISPNAVFLFMGTYMLMTGLYCSVFLMNFISIPEHVRNGTLDMYITKPISLQFITTLRNFNLGFAIPNVVVGIILIIIGWYNEGIPVSSNHLFGFIGYLLIGMGLCYAIFIIPQLLSFWVVKIDSIGPVSNAVWDMNQMPMDIYSKGIRIFGIYIIPVFVISNFAPQFVLGNLEKTQIYWPFFALLIFMLISRWVWNIALKRYTSVNS